MNKLTYSNFKFIIQPSVDNYFTPHSVTINLAYKSEADEYQILELLSQIDGCLIVSSRDSRFEKIIELHNEGIFDCSAVEISPEIITSENWNWLEIELKNYLAAQNIDVDYLFIN
jgi:hypothetical protein